MTVFFISMVMVMGPTPPGTGVMQEATSLTVSKSTSPASLALPDSVMPMRLTPTSMTQAPVDEAQQEVLAVYCSLLGSLIELKHAEEAVRESEALYRRAIEAAGAVPYYLDYATESYRFVGEGI